MLKRIVRVTDFRAMKAWTSSVEFRAVNLIYGVNGSGKSTLSALFQEYPQGSNVVGPVSIEVADLNGAVSTINAVDDYFWPNVRVFNRSYVNRNIRFNRTDGTDAEALLTLGERQIEAEARKEEIQTRLDAIGAEQTAPREVIRVNTQARSSILTRTARQIGEELQNTNNRFNIRSYRSTNAEGLLRDRQAVDASASADIPADLVLIGLQAMESLTLSLDLLSDLTNEVRPLSGLLQTTVTSVAIPALVADSALATWVQTGIHLHDERSTCQFCGSPISEQRRHELSQHFDDSLLSLQHQLTAFRASINSSLDVARNLRTRLPLASQLYENQRAQYLVASESLDAELAKYIEYGDALVASATTKAGRPFSELQLPELPTPGHISLDEIEGIVAAHNQQATELQQTKDAAAKRLESARVQAIFEDVDAHSSAIDAAQLTLDGLDTERELLLEERAALPASELNPQPLADILNCDLAHLIGRDDLTFSVSDGRYAILRSGHPATHLSEGEQTAISLLYFLSSLEQHDVDPTRLTVIIDDPVSSLDSNVLVGASSHLWSRLVNTEACKQLFVLTHNFDLFRMWSNQIDRRRRSEIRSRPAAMFEIRMRSVTNPQGGSRRSPVLDEWPTDLDIRKRIRSEYHYLFWRLAHTLEECRTSPSPERDIDAAAILPNVARRVMEGFLAFKYPDLIDNFEGAVTRANEHADPITQGRIVRFLHQFSHNSEGDTGRSIPRPEAVTVLTAVFDLMKSIDPDHLTAMCVALEINENEVTSSPTSADATSGPAAALSGR
jgi:wobble nucleotide-excising tRNase